MSFYLSKVLWSIINPFNILLFFIFFGVLLHILFRNNFHKFFYFIALVIFIIGAVMPTGNFMFFQLEKKFHDKFIFPNKIDGILILSGATNPGLSKEYDQIHLNDSAERLTESFQLINRYPMAKVIFSGGSGSINADQLTHSDVAKDFFEQFNFDINNIIFESKSRNTYENILYSKKIVKPDSDEKWLLITSASHMTRALNIGEKLNWTFIPYPVDFHASKEFSWKPSMNFYWNFYDLQIISHEWVGLIAYYFMGRTNKIY